MKQNSYLAPFRRLAVASFPMLTRKTMLTFLGVALCAGIVFAQGFSGSSQHPSYDVKKPLPLSLPEAYALAMFKLGDATNTFHCVTATCLGTGGRSKGWTFGFSSTNAEPLSIKVFFYNAEAWVDRKS